MLNKKLKSRIILISAETWLPVTPDRRPSHRRLRIPRSSLTTSAGRGRGRGCGQLHATGYEGTCHNQLMYSPFNGSVNPLVLVILLALTLWSGVWKAIALWRAGRDNSLAWFIVLCIINTVGILEIIYIFAVSRPNRARQLGQ